MASKRFGRHHSAGDLGKHGLAPVRSRVTEDQQPKSPRRPSYHEELKDGSDDEYYPGDEEPQQLQRDACDAAPCNPCKWSC